MSDNNGGADYSGATAFFKLMLWIGIVFGLLCLGGVFGQLAGQ